MTVGHFLLEQFLLISFGSACITLSAWQLRSRQARADENWPIKKPLVSFQAQELQSPNHSWVDTKLFQRLDHLTTRQSRSPEFVSAQDRPINGSNKMPQSFNWSILLDHGRDLFIFKPSFPGITNAEEKPTFKDTPKGPSAPAAMQPGQMCSRPIEPVQRSTIKSCTHGSCMKSKKRLTSWWFLFHRPTKA